MWEECACEMYEDCLANKTRVNGVAFLKERRCYMSLRSGLFIWIKDECGRYQKSCNKEGCK